MTVPDLSIILLGSFAVHFQDKPISRFRSNKIRALLAYLALEPNQDHSRNMLAGLLWPEGSDKQALRSLRVALYHLRQSLDEVSADLAQKVLAITRQTIRLDTAAVTVHTDVIDFQTLLAASQAHSHANLSHCSTCLSHLRQAAECYRGELLAGFALNDVPGFEAWLLLKREMLHQQALLTFKDLADSYETLNEYDQAYAYASRLLNLDPHREASHRQLIRLLAYRGFPDQALAQFATCRQLLRDELGVEPAAETIALRDQIRQGQLHPDIKPLPPKPVIPPPISSASPKPSVQLDVPLIGPFFGRGAEMRQLKQWLVDERCRLVAILGLGGMGKTSLATQCVRKLMLDEDQPPFEAVLWRSLVNAPPLKQLLPPLLQTLADQALAEIPDSTDEQLYLLLGYLRDQRVLVVLDNLESILQPGGAGEYRPGYEPYSQLIEHLATHEHQSHLLLTSRERPRGYHRLERDGPGIRSLSLGGLDTAAGQTLLAQRGLQGEDEDQVTLINRYSGNPLALKLVSDTVDELFEGNLTQFLTDDTLIFDDIRTVLDQHFERLSDLEQQILFWLTIEREPISPQALRQNLLRVPQQRRFLEALRGLQRCALVEHPGAGFGLQNVVTEYLTERLVEIAIAEIETGNLDRLQYLALLKAEAKAYVRQSQARLILNPIADWLLAKYGQVALENHLLHLIKRLQVEMPAELGYASGNILNLLLHMGIDVAGTDFSHLSIWQANLQNVRLSGVNFAGADLAHSVFTDTFGAVYSVAISSGGTLLAAGTIEGDIRLMRMANGQPLMVLKGHPDWVPTVAFSPDDQTLASGSADQTVRLWDVKTKQVQHVLEGHDDGIATVAFSPDGATLASGGVDRLVQLWEVKTGQIRYTLRGHKDWIQELVFSPDGQILATGSRDDTIRLWDPHTGQCCHILKANSDGVESIAISPDGTLLASGGFDHTVQLWDLKNRQVRYIFRGHTSTVPTVAFTPDGETLVSGSRDHTIRAWDIKRGQIDHIFQGHTNTVLALAFSPDGRTLVSGSYDQTVRLWDIESRQAGHTLQGYTNRICSIAYHPDCPLLASGSSDQIVRIWNVKTGQICQTLPGHDNWVWSTVFSPDGSLLASGSADQTVRLWDVKTGQTREILSGHLNEIKDIAFSPDGQTLASCGFDHTTHLWDVQTGQVRHILQGHSNWVLAIAFSPDGSLLASGSADQTVRLWDVKTGQQVATFQGHSQGIETIAFSPDGSLLASGSWDRTVRLWDVKTGQTHHRFIGHTSWVRSVAFSPDGQSLASGGNDNTIRVWDVSSGDVRQALVGHSNWIYSLAYSPDGQTLASSSGNDAIKVWDAETGECLATWQIPGPYEGMNITGVTGISEAQRATLKALGAI